MIKGRSIERPERRRSASVIIGFGDRDLWKAGVMGGYHTRWERPLAQQEDPERVAIREALAFGKALYDRRVALGLSTTELAGRADMTVDEIECIEEGGTAPTLALLRHLAAALDADVRLTAGHDLGSLWFEAHAA
jgi:DNA-binding XRE family transcriptional regulator